MNQDTVNPAFQLENELGCLDGVRQRNFRLVSGGTGFLDALMSAGAFKSAIRSNKVRTGAEIAGAKDKFHQLPDRGGNDPLFWRDG